MSIVKVSLKFRLFRRRIHLVEVVSNHSGPTPPEFPILSVVGVSIFSGITQLQIVNWVMLKIFRA